MENKSNLLLNKENSLLKKELEEFEYSVSHDLRAPLRAITGFGNILAEDYSKELTGKALEYVVKIISNTTKLEEQINGLLELSRLSQKKVNIERLNVSDIFCNEVKKYSSYNAEIIIEKDLFENTDLILTSLILDLLLDNAFKFSSTINKPVIEFGKIKDKFYLKDNGVGFDLEYSSRLFTPFARFHKENDYDGIGIGLAKVKKLLKRLGGNISCETKIRSGTTFHFNLSAK